MVWIVWSASGSCVCISSTTGQFTNSQSTNFNYYLYWNFFFYNLGAVRAPRCLVLWSWFHFIHFAISPVLLYFRFVAAIIILGSCEFAIFCCCAFCSILRFESVCSGDISHSIKCLSVWKISFALLHLFNSSRFLSFFNFPPFFYVTILSECLDEFFLSIFLAFSLAFFFFFVFSFCVSYSNNSHFLHY